LAEDFPTLAEFIKFAKFPLQIYQIFYLAVLGKF
jgi:hypothetical protein